MKAEGMHGGARVEARHMGEVVALTLRDPSMTMDPPQCAQWDDNIVPSQTAGEPSLHVRVGTRFYCAICNGTLPCACRREGGATATRLVDLLDAAIARERDMERVIRNSSIEHALLRAEVDRARWMLGAREGEDLVSAVARALEWRRGAQEVSTVREESPPPPEPSTRWASRRVRSTWRRKRVPRPLPECAPSIRPGMSATT